MSKSPKSIVEHGGHIQRDIIISSMMDETNDKEESKLDPRTLSGDSRHAVAEGGLIR